MINKKIKFRLFLWIALLLAIFWFFWMGIAPTGSITYKFDFNKKSDFISKLSPNERLVAGDRLFENIIVGDPVYFNLRTPRPFNTAQVKLKYRNNTRYPIIESGLLVDGTLWRYDLQPVENSVLDNLAKKWDLIRQDNLMLLQNPILNSTSTISSTTIKYNSIEEFLNSPPNSDQVALYNSDLKSEYLLSDYASSSEVKTLDYSLRGSFQFYTYIKDEEMNFDFKIIDLNLNKDEDPVDVILYYDKSIIDSRHLDDDGNSKDNGLVGEEREINLKLSGLPEGAYKIELRANDDIVTKSIITNLSKISFQNKVWLSEEADNLSLWTDSSLLQVKTINPGSLQTITFADKILDVTETYKQFSAENASSSKVVSKITLEKNDVIIEGNGVFTFSKEMLINPQFKKVDSKFNTETKDVYYVFADYSPPDNQGEWKVNKLEHDLTRAYTEKGNYKFIISIPGLKNDNGRNEEIVIDEIEVNLYGESLIDFIKRKIYEKN